MYKTESIRKTGIALVATAALVVASVSSSFAANTGTVTATAGITGGDLTIVGSPAGATLGTTLDGDDKLVGGNLGTITVADPRGTGDGWSVTLAATAFTGTSGAANGKTLPTLTDVPQFVLNSVGVNPVKGVAPIADSAIVYGTGLNIIGSTATKVYAATTDRANAHGMGKFQITPAITLSVPAQAYAGNYTSTVTITLQNSP